MSTYNYAACPLTTELRNAITTATALTLTARIRPTWSNDGERFTFGVSNDPDQLVGGSSVTGPIIDCQSNRTGGGTYNAIGASWRTGALGFRGGSMAPSSVLADRWIDIAATIDSAAAELRLFDRPADAHTWNPRGVYAVATGSGFGLNPEASMLMAGNRRTNFAPNGNTVERWPGGIARVALSIGTGPSATPGGTEIAEWHATPPDPTYTDPHGNTWTLTGDTWTWGTVT